MATTGRGQNNFDAHVVNAAINAPYVRMIDQNGKNCGRILTETALSQAKKAGLDLVLLVPEASLPVARIMDYGRYRYEQKKRLQESRRNQKQVELKEIKLRPGIDNNDLNIKLRQLRSFIEGGDKVKVTLRLRGRELRNARFALRLLDRVTEITADYARVEHRTALEGRQSSLILAPLQPGKTTGSLQAGKTANPQ